MRPLVLLVHFTLLTSSCLAAGTPADKPESSPTARPNVLLLMVDDLRPALGCYGDPLARTPNIDRFASQARIFNRAYVQQAVCGPSRTSLLTGLLPNHSRVWHNRNRFRENVPGHVTLPQAFKQHGYRTTSLGKVFSGNRKELDPDSWSESEILRLPDWKNYITEENQGNGKKQAAFEYPDVADDAYPDGKLADLAIETLAQLEQQNQPFFLAVGFFKPHLPFNAPRAYWDRFDSADFELPADQEKPPEGVPQIAYHTHRELGGYKGVPANEQLDREQTRTLRHGYYACVSYVDAQVGRILESLDRLGLDDNTTVILCGDHGFALGENGRWCKGTNFEVDTRVPLIVRTPGLRSPGVATDSLVELVDVYPTLAELANLEVQADIDGVSFAGVVADPQCPGRSAVLSQFNRPWTSSGPNILGYSLRTQNRRYTRWVDTRRGEITEEEVYEYANLSDVRPKSSYLIERRNIATSEPQILKLLSQQMDDILGQRIDARIKQ